MKADGCDLVSGLEESVRHEWNGDVDLGSGELQILYDQYMHRLTSLLSLLSSSLQDRVRVLQQESSELRQDNLYVSEGNLFICHTVHNQYQLF